MLLSGGLQNWQAPDLWPWRGDTMSDNVIDIGAAVKRINANARSTARYAYGRLQTLLGVSHNGKRDIYDIYGYPQDLSGEDGFALMYRYAKRMGVAKRITFGIAQSCWRDGFEIRTDVDDESTVQLEAELGILRKQSNFLRRLERVDTLNRIGRFAVLFVGVPDGLDPDEPLGTANPNQLGNVYFAPYAYDSVEPKQFDNDPLSPRYGLPTLYQLSRSQRRSDEKDYSSVTPVMVHWSRIVLLSENLLDSELEGMGALEPVFNRLLDLDKACGGSSEAYFRNARRIIAYEVDKDFAPHLLSDDRSKAKFDEEVEKFTNEQKDQLTVVGSKANSLMAPHYSPMDTVKVSLYEIAACTGIPLRVLTGEGAGQLAGSEDQLAYNNLIADRQKVYCSEVLQSVFGILAQAGLLRWQDDYEFYFPPQQASTETTQAAVAKDRASTFEAVMRGLSTPAADAVSAESVFTAMDLSDIEVTDVELDDVGDELDEPEPPTNGDDA